MSREISRRKLLALSTLSFAGLACRQTEERGPRVYDIPWMSTDPIVSTDITKKAYAEDLSKQLVQASMLPETNNIGIAPLFTLNGARLTRPNPYDERRGRLEVLTDISDDISGRWRAAVISGQTRFITEFVQVGQASEVVGKNRIYQDFAKFSAIKVEFIMPSNNQGNIEYFKELGWEIYLERYNTSGDKVSVDKRLHLIVFRP